MKKILAAFFLCLCCMTVSADDYQDRIFNELVSATNSQLPAGGEAHRDGTYRIMYINYPLDIHSSNGFNTAAAKKAIVDIIRGTKDADILKRSNGMIIYNYITTDRKVFSITITAEDL